MGCLLETKEARIARYDMSEHLKGWRLSAGDETRVFDGNDNRLVDVPCGGMSGRSMWQAEDCARLIAAAPELLEALEIMLTAFAGYADTPAKKEAIALSDAAITRAKGGE